MRSELAKLVEGKRYHVALRSDGQVSRDHPGQAAKIAVRDATGERAELEVFKSSPVKNAEWTEGAWYSIKNIKVYDRDTPITLRATGDTEVTGVDDSLETLRSEVTTAAASVDMLALGYCYIGRSNLSSSRQIEYNEAFDRAVSVAIERDVDAIVLTGGLLWTRPDATYVTRLRESLKRLREESIPCLHVRIEKASTEKIIQNLYESDLLTPLTTDPTWIDDVVVYGTDPEEPVSSQVATLSFPEEASNAVVVTSQDLQLDKLEREADPVISTVIVGQNKNQRSKRGLINLVGPGPIEPALGKWVFDGGDPYPGTVTEVTVSADGVSWDEHELSHRPLWVIDVLADRTTSVDGIWQEIKSGEYEDDTVILRVRTPKSPNDRIVNALASRFESDAALVKTYSAYGTPTDGLEVSVTHHTPETDGFKERVEVYACEEATSRGVNSCVETFTRRLCGDVDPRETSRGDTLVLHNRGNSRVQGSDDEFLYGPFEAVSDAERNIEAEAWDRTRPYQVRIEPKQKDRDGDGYFYRLPADKARVSLRDRDVLSGEEATVLLETLEKKGTAVMIARNGKVEPVTERGNDEGIQSRNEGENEKGGNSAPDQIDPVQSIAEKRELAEPLPKREHVLEADQPGVALLQAAVSGEERPDIYREALVHLVAGKNLILYGPPGSGKTRLAKRIGAVLTRKLHIATANAEWTNQDVVGGYRPGSDGFEPDPGVFTEAAKACEQSLHRTEPAHPVWLLIDELNRANLDEAFGEVFTLLDLPYRVETSLTYADGKSQKVPLAFRVLGTMNSEDQAQLFALGYAFRRRFAFVEVPPLYESRVPEQPQSVAERVNLTVDFERMNLVLERALVTGFEYDSDQENDSALGIPLLEELFEPQELLDAALQDIKPPESDLEFDRAILAFVQRLDEAEVAQIGQGLILDAYKYVLTHYVLFPRDTDWHTVDEAVSAYILPQLESYTAELRRAKTVASDTDSIEAFESVIDCADELGFVTTKERLWIGLESHEIIG